MKKMLKITDFAFVLPGLIAVAVILGPFTSIAASVTIEIPIEAYDTANAAAAYPDEPDPSPDDQLLDIYGHITILSYLAFDLNELPQGFEIVGATVSVFDIEPEHEDEVEIALLDVPTDWDRETLTYNIAVDQYGAIVATDSNDAPIAAFDPTKVLWLGNALMDNKDAPGRATVGSRREMLSVSPLEEANLAAALKEERTNGDGLVTMAIHGTTRNDNQILGIGFSDSEKGPTLSLILAASGGSGTTTMYSFDDGTLQGWTQIWNSTTAGGPTELGLISTDDPSVGNSVPPLPLSPPSFIGPVPFEADDGTNTRDQAHETLLIRSPDFRVYPNGQISFALIGGSHPNLDLEDITDANALPWDSSSSGAIGVALRRVSDGRYVSFYSRSESGSQFWETITLGEDELSGLVSGDEMYTLDFIDYHNGGWGWGAIDSVVIVEGTPVTTYDFDDGTLQGWTQIWNSTTAGGPTELGLISTDDPSVGNSVPPLPLSPPSFIGPVPFEADDGTNTRDQAHEAMLIRSPDFRVYPNGQISFALIGGSHPNLDVEEITDANALPWNSSGSGAIGVALRRVSDGRYLDFYARSESGSQFWETITLGEDELSGLVSGGEMYTLDFIDYHNGGWGWGAIDSVVIIEGTPVTTYDFDDRTLQGWTQVWGSTTPDGPTNLGLISEDDPAVGNSVPPLPLSLPSFVGPVPFEGADGTNTRDQAHETLLIRSPEFRIYPNGQISFGLIGGSHPNLDVEEITDANALPWNSSGSGAIGVALRRVSDGRYLDFYARSESGSQFWETITLGEDELSGLVSGGEMCTLDFIDYHNGGWGWGAIDSVVIIEEY